MSMKGLLVCIFIIAAFLLSVAVFYSINNVVFAEDDDATTSASGFEEEDDDKGEGGKKARLQDESLGTPQEGHINISGNAIIGGSVKIGDDSADCTSAIAGTIRFNGTSFEGCDGVAWISLSASGSGGAFTCGVDQVQDVDGNRYNTVLIGT